MFQECVRIPKSKVIESLNNKFGDYNKIFSKFSFDPIGTASLAQVHKAVLKETGEIVAVKIQHPRLSYESRGDLALIKKATQIASYLFPDFQYKFLSEQFELNLPKELDFTQEAENCNKFRRLFKNYKYVVAPKIYDKYCSSKLLVMSFEEGGSIEDPKYLKENNISPKEISKLMSLCFNKQIFKFGFVHADPHSGNIRVRKLKNNRIQLILLDHGLYREIDDEFRYYYSNFWRGVLNQNQKLIEDSCKNLNISHYHLFTSMILNKKYDDVMTTNKKYSDTRFQLANNKKDKDELRKHVQDYHKDMTIILNNVRQEMLLLMKVNEYLRAIDRSLGIPMNNFFTMMNSIYKNLPENPVFKLQNESKLVLNLEYYKNYFFMTLYNMFLILKIFVNDTFYKNKISTHNDKIKEFEVFSDLNNKI